MRAEFEVVYHEEPPSPQTIKQVRKTLLHLKRTQRRFADDPKVVPNKQECLVEYVNQENAELEGKAKIQVSFTKDHPPGEDWVGVDDPRLLTVREMINQLEKLDPDLRVFDRSGIDGGGGACVHVSEALMCADNEFFTEEQVLNIYTDQFTNGTAGLERVVLIESDNYDLIHEFF